MGCDFTYEFTEKAEMDLDGILKYIGEELCNKTAAKNIFKKTVKAIETICAYPDSGMLVNNEYISEKTIRRVLINDYIMYYKTDEENKHIIVIRIVFGKRDLTDLMKKI